MFKTRVRAARLGIIAMALSAFMAGNADAQALRIAMSADVTSMDPHFYNATPNNTVAFHVFEPLILKEADGRLSPNLAESWQAVGETEWRIVLRQDVQWHDGTPVTADDVVYSLTRLDSIEGAPGGFSSLINTITAVEAVDEHTVSITTSVASPTIPVSLSFIAIVPKANEGLTPEDYNAGRGMNGTGPFRFVRFVSGDRVELVRNEGWWRGSAPWENVTLRIIPNTAVRTTSLISGDLDLIETPSASDLQRLQSDDNLRVVSVRGDRVAYVNPIMVVGEGAERITDAAGKPIDPTPMADPRVRRALSLAINREGLSERIMLGTSSPTGQLMPEGMFSSLPDYGLPPYDPQAAKALLAEAGFPDGFNMSLTAANDRVPYNVEVAQAIAQMWTRIGVNTTVNGVPTSVYVRQASSQQIPAYLGNWGNSSGEAGRVLIALLHSHDPDGAAGSSNWSRYSNPTLDAKINEAVATVDDAARDRLLQEATQVLLDDQGLIPLYHFNVIWAMHTGFNYAARSDGLTLAQYVSTAAE